MDHEDQIQSLRERVAVNEQSIKSAHARIDQMTLGVKEEIKELKDDVKIVLAYLERSKGMIAIFMVIAGVLGYVIQIVIKAIFH